MIRMMMLSKNKDKNYNQLEENYEKLRKRNKFLRRRALIFAVLVFVVNAYAWFVYISEADVRTNARVKNWDLNFYDGTTAVKEVTINPELYPGMQAFTKSLNIVNASDVKADIEYTVKDVLFAGQPMYDTTTTTDAQAIDVLTNQYPFKVEFLTDKQTLDETDNAAFTVKITWPYENATLYYKVGYAFNYSADFSYYTYDDNEDEYTLDTTVNSSNFETKKSTLYMNKDDIDSYLGGFCGAYQQANNLNCLKFTVQIKAKQRN
ncbi:MAG: hypothetical protein IJI43_03510 [Bacilli bacterium]|nr:hypothetical protein [Bacilli bacterium]